MSTLTCPKCTSDMRQYERNEVHVDQCTGCGGLFLDRGELERLVQAENAWNASAPAAAPTPAAPTPAAAPASPAPATPAAPPSAPSQGYQQYPQQGYQDQGYQQQYRDSHGKGYDPRYGHKRKKKSFLENLFDD